jgi:LPXTG-motif cell wall-anchored protein
MTDDYEPRNDMELDAEEAQPPEESNNRTFLIVAGILGGITLLALVCIAVYAFVVLPGQRARQAEQLAAVAAQNTQVALALTQTSEVAAFTPTFTVTLPPANTPTKSPTPVVAVPTNTTQATVDPKTATVAALLTQAAIVTQTVMPTATALPSTGFVEDVGIPGLMGMAVLLIAVIFLARRLRTAA